MLHFVSEMMKKCFCLSLCVNLVNCLTNDQQQTESIVWACFVAETSSSSILLFPKIPFLRTTKSKVERKKERKEKNPMLKIVFQTSCWQSWLTAKFKLTNRRRCRSCMRAFCRALFPISCNPQIQQNDMVQMRLIDLSF
jgi:hypothetical protein